MANPNPSKKFTKGDKRINRKGRKPNNFNLRALAESISYELIESAELNKMITLIEAILRDWANSGDFLKQKLFVEYAYGKPKEEAIEDKNVITVVYTNDTD